MSSPHQAPIDLLRAAASPHRARATTTAATLALLAAALAPLAACRKSDYRPPWAGGLPFVADANRDGVEDMITYGGAYGLTAFDGRTYKPLWTRKDLDIDLHDARRLAAVAGRTLIVARDRSLQLLDLTDGQTRAALPLTDKVYSLCAAGAAAWVRQLDEVTGLVDPSQGPAAARLDPAAPRPEACAPDPGRHFACEHSAARCATEPSTMSMRLTDTTAAPPTSLSVEFKAPGTPEVTLVLPDGQRLLFDREGARVHAVDLAGGHLFLKRQGGVTAVEATTGRTLWTVPCSGNTPYLRATPTRVYVECEGPRQYEALRVLDHTGAVLTDLGEPRH